MAYRLKRSPDSIAMLGTDWTYELFVSKAADEVPVSRVEAIVASAVAQGWLLRRQDHHPIAIYSLDGQDCRECPDREAALHVLAESGGMLELWSEETDIGLTIDLRGDSETTRSFLHGGRAFSLAFVRLGIDRAHLREGRHLRDLERKVTRLFVAMAHSDKARFGYCCNEVLLTKLVHQYAAVVMRAERLEPPPMLFHRNYFCREYATHVEASLAEAGLEVTRVDGAVLASIGRYVWDMPDEVIESATARWSALSV